MWRTNIPISATALMPVSTATGNVSSSILTTGFHETTVIYFEPETLAAFEEFVKRLHAEIRRKHPQHVWAREVTPP
jgi:hypothetical protein